MRTVPYSPALREDLTKYFKSLKAYPSVYLFENRDEPGRAITVRGVQYIVKEVVKRSRLKRDIHPHTFRHTYAVHNISNGCSLLRLKELMGHEYIETTLHYLKYCSIPLTDIPTPLQMMMNRIKEREARKAAIRASTQEQRQEQRGKG